MDEELKNRFTKQKIEDLLNGNTHKLPTIICEMDEPRITEMVRKNVMLAIEKDVLVPFTSDDIKPPTQERLEKSNLNNYGNLYIDININ